MLKGLRSFTSVAAVATALAATPSAGQQAGAVAGGADQASVAGAPTGADDQAADGGVGDIIVTAQRVAQSLQRVPVSVQPVTGKELEERKLNDLVQLQTVVPSLAVGTDNSFSLRGVGSLNFSPNVDSSVGVAIDDVSLGVPLFMNYFGFEDVERVEVLLGPQGLLFGRNASAGLLNVVTRRPELGEWSGHVYGETDYRDTTPGGGWGEIVRGTVNAPVSDKAAFRLNLFYSDQDPIAKVVVRTPTARFGDYQRRFGAKGKFLYEPTDRLSVYLIGDYASNRGIGGIYDRTLRSTPTGSLTATVLQREGIVAGTRNLRFGYSAPYGGADVDTGGASATVTWKATDALTISNIFAWRAYHAKALGDLDFTSADGVDLNIRAGRYRQFSNEFRVALDAGPLLDGQAGLYYFGSRLRERDAVGAAAYGALDPLLAALVGPSNSVTNPYIGLDNLSLLKNRSYAAFGQFNLHPVERLTLIAGGRVTRDNNNIAINQNQRPYPIPLGAPNYRTKERVRNTDFSWKLGGQYDVQDVGMLYATYSRGYKGPAFNDTATVAGQRLAIGPETVHAAEIGAKTTLFDRRLRLNVSAFHQIFDDFQVQGYDARTQSYFTSNAAKVRSQGIEGFAEARPFTGLTLSVAATYLDAKFRRFPNDRCYPGQPDCSTVGTTDSSGNRTPSSAKFTSTVQAAYERPIVEGATLALSASYYHRSPINFAANANPAQRLGTIDTLDGSIGTTIDGRFRLALFCKNCTDKRFPVFIGSDSVDATLLGVNSTTQTWGYNSIRTIGLSAGFDF